MLGIDPEGFVALFFFVVEERADIRLKHTGTSDPDVSHTSFAKGGLDFRRQLIQVFPVAYIAFGVCDFASCFGATQEIFGLWQKLDVCNENSSSGRASQLDKGQVDACELLVLKTLNG
jgi:hypothetical protein